MSTPESKATTVVRLEASRLGCRVFRNNSGACKDDTGRLIRYGLGNESKKLNQQFKSGDLIGCTPIVITPDMVGQTIGVFTNIEVKAEGKVKAAIKRSNQQDTREWAQGNFIKLVLSLGGYAGFASNEEEVQEIIKNDTNEID
jgi:hypothetical protein